MLRVLLRADWLCFHLQIAGGMVGDTLGDLLGEWMGKTMEQGLIE
jgi:hypothetical protein